MKSGCHERSTLAAVLLQIFLAPRQYLGENKGMQVKLRPETQRFIEEQVNSGRFPSSDELLDEAVGRMMSDQELSLDAETLAVIKRAEDQFARGEDIDFDVFAAEMRRKIAVRQ
jgi:Arc/MetJ-type ribon-helix-helix transcriptional regulator